MPYHKKKGLNVIEISLPSQLIKTLNAWLCGEGAYLTRRRQNHVEGGRRILHIYETVDFTANA
jgi:hypothetical protein